MERIVIWYRSVPGALGEEGLREQCDAAIFWLHPVVGRPVTGSGNSVVWTADPVDLEPLIERILARQVDADEETGGCFAIALGETSDEGEGAFPRYRGEAFDRAQFLANRIRAHEIVLDNESHEIAQRTYLFARRVGSGAISQRGHVLDMSYPYRIDCQKALVHLRRAPLPSDLLETLGEIEPIVERSGSQDVIVLRGEEGCGARAWMLEMARSHKPPLVIHMSAVPGGLEPLGSLRWALLRPFGESNVAQGHVAHGYLDGDEASQAALISMIRGGPVPRADVLRTLLRLLHRVEEMDSRAWLFLHSTTNIDPATQDLLAALLQAEAPLLLVARVPGEGEIPAALARFATVHEVQIPPLRQSNARAIVASMANVSATGDIATRAALLGGSTFQGAQEAVRALVAAGDLTYAEGEFVWRLKPRRGTRALPLDAILEDRLTTLLPQDLRILEGVCIAPEGFPPALIEAVLALDDLGDGEMRESLARLRAEQLLSPTTGLTASSVALRRHVVGAMPPARVHELHRFYARVIGSSEHGEAEFARATWGFYIADGGDVQAGVSALLRAAASAYDAGWNRAAVRLAASAIQTDPSTATRAAATKIARLAMTPAAPAKSAEGQPPAPESQPPSANDAQKQAIRALIQGDHENVERLIEVSIAEGHDLAAADRLRAMAYLARGDIAAATRALDRARSRSGNDQRQLARASLTLAWILLHQQKASEAVRAALGALANARAMKDPRGEAAAMHTISACFRAIGWEKEANAIADGSPD